MAKIKFRNNVAKSDNKIATICLFITVIHPPFDIQGSFIYLEEVSYLFSSCFGTRSDLG